MTTTIFYSWQSDLPNSTNRNFLESVLEQSIRAVAANGELAEAERNEELKLDKDTKGVPGIPPIADVILDKISSCAVFVPDLTFVGATEEGRLLSNPNVLIEYGWALSKLGHPRIIPIMNSAYGEVSAESLPFDMRHLRHPVTYSLMDDASPKEKARVKQALIKRVSGAISLILDHAAEAALPAEPAHHVPVSSTSDPSTFLQEGEPLLLQSSFGNSDRELLLPGNQHLYLRLMPIGEVKCLDSSLEAYDLLLGNAVRPLGHSYGGWSHGRNRHGAFSVSHDEMSILGLTQFFLNQELWGIDADSLDKKNCMSFSGADFGFIAGGYVEEACIATLASYLKFYREVLKMQAPVKLIAGMTGVAGYKMSASSRMSFGRSGQFHGRVDNDNLERAYTIEDLACDPAEILEPFFTYLWKECGLKRPAKKKPN